MIRHAAVGVARCAARSPGCAGACTIYNAIRASDGSARIYGSWRILPSGATERERKRKREKKKTKKKKEKKKSLKPRRKKKKRDGEERAGARSMQGLYSRGMSYTPPAVPIHYLSLGFSLFLRRARPLSRPRNSPVSGGVPPSSVPASPL